MAEPQFSGKRVLVTGGGGFIGSHLIEALLAQGAQVASLDHKPAHDSPNLRNVIDRIHPFQLNLENDDLTEILKSGNYDIVFHLSASAQVEASIKNPAQDLNRNTVATVNLLESLRRTSPDTAVVFTSSAVVFAGGDETPIKEDDPTHPTTPYGVSKLAAERYLSVYANLFDLRTATVRLFSAYGPRLRKQIVYDFMCRLKENPELLRISGNGTEARDLSYIDDVIQGLLLVSEKAPMNGEAYNLASGTHVTTIELAKHLARSFGGHPEFELTGSTHIGDTKFWIADTSRIRALGYKPKVKIASGIDRTVDWFQNLHEQN